MESATGEISTKPGHALRAYLFGAFTLAKSDGTEITISNRRARATYCTLLDGLHQTMADPYDQSIAFPAIWMGHAELVMKIYSEQTSLANLFGLLTLWAETDPIRRTREHPDFMAFAERMGFVAAWDKYGWPDRLPAPPDRK